MAVIRPPQFDRKWRRKRRWSARLARWRPWLVVAALAAVTVALTGLPPMSREGDPVDLRFALCGQGPASACVIDGDTIAVGRRRVRLTGFDAPELDGACTAEIAKAREAREALLQWPNRAPFLLNGAEDTARDRYGRELREAWREPGGRASAGRQPDMLADWMIERGLAAETGWGASATDWCT